MIQVENNVLQQCLTLILQQSMAYRAQEARQRRDNKTFGGRFLLCRPSLKRSCNDCHFCNIQVK